MNRTSFIAAPLLLGALFLGLPAFADDAATTRRSEQLGQQWINELQAAADAEKAGDSAAAQRHYDAARRYKEAMESAKTLESSGGDGALGKVEELRAQLEAERAKAEIDQIRAQSEATRKMYDKPGFFEKFGDKAVDIIGGLISQLLQKWIAGGGKDDDLLNQIRDLQAERDELMNARNDPTDPAAGDGGLGRIITDSTGAHGYDRDGDGFVDIPINSDGSLGDYNPSSPTAYTNTDPNGAIAAATKEDKDKDKDSPYPPFYGGGGSGGASMGSGMGAGMNPAGEPGAAGAKAGEDESFPGAKDAEAKAKAEKEAKDKDKDGDGKPDADSDRPLETVVGRLIVLVKSGEEKAGNELAGDRKAGGDEWSDDGWSDDGWGDDKKGAAKPAKKADDGWGDDGWNDAADNGDTTKGAPGKGKVGTGADAAELVDQIIRVETKVAEWRQKEKDKLSGGDGEEGFGDDMSGYQKPNAEKDDPFKAVRDKDGKIDLKKVEIWLVARDSWKEGKEPVRYRVTLSPELTGFEPLDGGYMVVRGELKDLDVDQKVKNVLSEIKGELKQLEMVQVILSAEKPPENMDALDPAATTDEGVGGPKKSEWGSDEDAGW